MALNTGDINAAVGVYGDGAVLMAEGSPPAVGLDAIKQTYDGIFKAVGLQVAFTVDEIVVLGDTAWVRTHSSGEMNIRAAGIKVPGKSSELFIFEKQKNGEWRIARYLFASQLPPKS